MWAMSATEYVKRAIEEVERELHQKDAFLPKRVETPLSSGYLPELDFSVELDSQQTNYYQGLIGVLRWIVELGRIFIYLTKFNALLCSNTDSNHFCGYVKVAGGTGSNRHNSSSIIVI